MTGIVLAALSAFLIIVLVVTFALLHATDAHPSAGAFCGAFLTALCVCVAFVCAWAVFVMLTHWAWSHSVEVFGR